MTFESIHEALIASLARDRAHADAALMVQTHVIDDALRWLDDRGLLVVEPRHGDYPVPPDLEDTALNARNVVTTLAQEVEINDEDVEAIGAAAKALHLACRAARRRVDDVLRVEDDLGREVEHLRRELASAQKDVVIVGGAGDPEPPPDPPDVEAIDAERELVRWRETLADLPREPGESEFDYGARKDVIRGRIRDLERRRHEVVGEDPLVKARRALETDA